ncbi:unnamed protein product [Ranitomeya imitator]|uniref:Uncharacterized protein n=1 Tax=Ranitomeya imitator TaxID=111125 RepID=A0ABN9MHI6_9NEOB|nr:unnamed protein product [Ranitomeya imitator]
MLLSLLVNEAETLKQNQYQAGLVTIHLSLASRIKLWNNLIFNKSSYKQQPDSVPTAQGSPPADTPENELIPQSQAGPPPLRLNRWPI